MLKAQITADLPSAEMENASGPLAWIKGIFGMKRDVSGQEALTVGAIQLLSGVADAFTNAGITNVISLLVDGKPVYLDAEDIPDDIDAMLEAAQSAGVLDKRYQELRLAFAHAEQGLQTLIEIMIQNEVVLGEEEMQVDIFSHIEEFTVAPNETARDYVERVQTTAKSQVRMETYRRDMHALAERLAQAIRGVLPDTTVTTLPAHYEITLPSPHQLGWFRNLHFGSQVKAPTYRPKPQARPKITKVADPFALYYYDPYRPLTAWALLDAMINMRALGTRSNRVLHHASAAVEFRGDQASKKGREWDGLESIGFTDSGDLNVGSHLPTPETDPAL